MHPTLTPHRNLLVGLVDELDRQGHAAQRRADDTVARAAELERRGVNRQTALITAQLESARERGIQDAHANIVGRLRSILSAPLSTIVDLGEVFDAVEAKLGGNDATSSPKPVTPYTAARVAGEVIDGLNVGGGR